MSVNTIDLMSNYRTHLGIAINLPEITIKRLHLKISIQVTITAGLNSADGVLLSAFVDGLNQTISNQMTNPYDEKDLIFYYLYLSETSMFTDAQAGGHQYTLYKEFDVRAMRRLKSVDDTLFLQISAGTGNVTIDNYSWTMSALVDQGAR